MDEFDNFFGGQNDNDPQKTPIYHTPDPKPKKNTTIASICIIFAVIMCLVVVVNVIVLATLKNSIADEYAASMSQNLQEAYRQAIEDVLNDEGVIDDVTQSASQNAVNALTSPIGKTANDIVSKSVARLYMYKSDSDTEPGLASGFIISDASSTSNERYLLTNAHCVRYEHTSILQTNYWTPPIASYKWATYNKIVAVFENDNTLYQLEPVACGSYSTSNLAAENNQADIAILKFVGTQPTNDEHPSLKIAISADSACRGTEIAVVGNPEGMGETTTITVGVISQSGVTMESWGSGTFLMTDAAVNGGNSGGPMVNSLGNVVGIVESKLVSTDIDNMAFALNSQTIVDFITWASNAQNNTLGVALNIDYTVV